jgi:hypothetical protein
MYMSGVKKLFLWVATFPASAIVGRVVFGQTWQTSLDGAWVATMAVGVGFLFEIARDALGELRSVRRDSQPDDSG